MTSPRIASAPRVVSALVPVILAELAALKRAGEIAPAKFEAQLRRLTMEELSPRGLSLTTRETADGHLMFVVRDPRGAAREVFEFPTPTPAAETALPPRH